MSTNNDPELASDTHLHNHDTDDGHGVQGHGEQHNHHTHHHSTDKHSHTHDHDLHDHHHDYPKGPIDWLLAIFHLGKHDHDHGPSMSGSIMETSARGFWAIKISFIGLMVTAIIQVFIVYYSGSVALLADTIHNFGDASTAIPLWIAFSLSRRPKTRRYTYGFGRAEDLAGLAVIGLILFSAIVAGYQAIDRIINPQEIGFLEWVAAAAIIGFIGNEGVAIFRIRVGREIGSAALVADGLHARIDGLTSLAVLVGAIGVWLGYPLADPIIGLVITVAILRITWNATKAMWYRMMDAVEPDVVDTVENTAIKIDGVYDIRDVRCRWVGHQLHANLHIELDPNATVARAHQMSEEVQHALFHVLPRLTDVSVIIGPRDHDP